MNEQDSKIQKAALILPGFLKGGSETKIPKLYISFYMILMEFHLALNDLVHKKSTTNLERLFNSEAFKKLITVPDIEETITKMSMVAETSFKTLPIICQNLLMALTELSFMQIKAEEQIVESLGKAYLGYAVAASNCFKTEVSELKMLKKMQTDKVNDLYELCFARNFGSRFNILRERAKLIFEDMKNARRIISDSSTLPVVHEALHFTSGYLRCGADPVITVEQHNPNFGNVYRRLQKHSNLKQITQTIIDESNPRLLSEKLNQLNKLNKDIDTQLENPDQTLFSVKERLPDAVVCAELDSLLDESTQLKAESLVLKEKLIEVTYQDFLTRLEAVRIKALECINASAISMKELLKETEDKQAAVNVRIEGLQDNLLEELKKIKVKTDLYNIGVCERAITKAFATSIEQLEKREFYKNRIGVRDLLLSITEDIKEYM